MRHFKGLCLSSFNVANFAQLLSHDEGLPVVRAEAGEYGQWFGPAVSQQDEGVAPDFLVVWTMPEHISPAFNRLLRYEAAGSDELARDVDHFCERIVKMKDRAPLVFVPLWLTKPEQRGLGGVDLVADGGTGRALMEMNLRLCNNLKGVRGVLPLNSTRWAATVGKRSFQPKLWYMAKSPFSNEFYAEAVRDIKAAIGSSMGRTKKLIVVDLDDTLWGGLVGEVGWEGIRLGGHDYVGEAHQDFQRALKALRNRGILLAIASKNNEEVALEAIRKHPEMVLRLEDFVGWRINWEDKAGNIANLVQKLNLGLDSVVFIDDSEFERQRVRSALPDVFVPDWPADKTRYATELMGLSCFDQAQVTAEDSARTRMYQEEQSRNQTRGEHESVEDWLASLDLTVAVKQLEESDVPRVVQLINKTNQMNLTTRRLSEEELRGWRDSTGADVWSIRVSDRYGDSGITGVLSVVRDAEAGDAARIVDFVLSCRVFGRKVENVMFHVAIQWAQARGKSRLLATYVPTEKNGVCLDFWKGSGCEWRAADSTFVWSMATKHALPGCIKVQGAEIGAADSVESAAV
jgi:FkbH-like protein